MIPISDDNPTRRRPFMTLLVGLACIVMFFYVQPSGTRSLDLATEGERLEEIEFSYEFAAIPCELTEDRSLTAQEIGATVLGGNTEACLEHAQSMVLSRSRTRTSGLRRSSRCSCTLAGST